MLFRYKIPATALAFGLLLCALQANALFDDGFQSHLSQKLGATAAKQLIRADLGINGSFGGNVKNPIVTYRDPLVLVHGLDANASSLLGIRDFFTRQGYGIGEIYATSYGPPSKTVDASSPLNCSYIVQLRQLITAVSSYTGGRRVNVIAYSIGVPLTRKAILGGTCVDTKQNLGSALTSQVGVFLSVAGANNGAIECNAYPSAALCNSANGLKSNSAFLRDINSKSGYEGRARYSIGSKNDDIVGFTNLSLAASQINVTLENYSHGDTLQNTLNIQLSLVVRGFVAQRTIDKDAYAESKVSGRNCSGTQTGSENFQIGPHESQLNNNDDGEFPGEYSKGVYQFVNGFNYTHWSNPIKGKFFNIRNKPYNPK